MGHYITENNSAAWAFCKALSIRTGRPVQLIVSAMGGQGIAQWMSGQTQWTKITNAITASGVTKVDAILWIQREADVSGDNDAWNNYYNKFTTLKNQFRALFATKTAPIIFSKHHIYTSKCDVLNR